MDKKYLIGIILTIILSGCSGVSYIQLGVENLPVEPFPILYTDLILVNNSHEQKADSSIFTFNDTILTTIPYEREDINEKYLNILAEKIQNSNYMNDVSIYNIPQKGDNDSPRKLLSSSQLDTIHHESGAEWILSLDRLQHMSIITKTYNSFPFAVHQMIIKADLSLYNYPNNQPVWKTTKTDTLKWEKYMNYKNVEAYKFLPDFNDCIYDAAYINAENNVLKWLPYITQEERAFIRNSDPSLREALDLYIKGDKIGCDIMLDYAFNNTKSNKVKQIACYNRALLAEERGDLEGAIDMIQKCINTDTTRESISVVYFEDYLKILKSRKEKSLL